MAAGMLTTGAVIAFPTDINYSAACVLSDKKAVKRLLTLHDADDPHSLICMTYDYSLLNQIAFLPPPLFRWMKAELPGPAVFLTEHTQLFEKISGIKKKKICCRMPACQLCKDISAAVKHTILLTGFKFEKDYNRIMDDSDEIKARFSADIDLILDGGPVIYQNPPVFQL